MLVLHRPTRITARLLAAGWQLRTISYILGKLATKFFTRTFGRITVIRPVRRSLSIQKFIGWPPRLRICEYAH